MSKELVVVEAAKDTKGAYVKPDRSTEKPDNIAFLPDASDPYVVHITGYDAGDQCSGPIILLRSFIVRSLFFLISRDSSNWFS